MNKVTAFLLLAISTLVLTSGFSQAGMLANSTKMNYLQGCLDNPQLCSGVGKPTYEFYYKLQKPTSCGYKPAVQVDPSVGATNQIQDSTAISHMDSVFDALFTLCYMTNPPKELSIKALKSEVKKIRFVWTESTPANAFKFSVNTCPTYKLANGVLTVGLYLQLAGEMDCTVEWLKKNL